jgi:DeoR/GlpR family transcriptional regulator of sugar metabolism
MNERQAKITELVKGDNIINVRDLAGLFGVSQMTIRRDLDSLQKKGLIIRTHGGGISAGKLRFLQEGFPDYSVFSLKSAIGKAAAGLVSGGQTIAVDSGTTALEAAMHLPQGADITVATTSLCVAQALYGSDINVLLLGGFLRKNFPGTYGPITEQMLKQFHVDILFIGCDGAISDEGFYTADMHVADLEKVMVSIADKVVVVTESSKFGRRAFSRYATPGQVHAVVTDAGLTTEDRRNLEAAGISVITA